MLELHVIGMTCSHCVRAVTHAVTRVDSQAELQVDLAAKRIRVDGRSTAADLIRVLGPAGYPARSGR